MSNKRLKQTELVFVTASACQCHRDVFQYYGMFWCREEIWEDTLTVVSQGLVPHEESISEDMTGNHTTCQAFTQIYFLPPDNDEEGIA